VNKDDGESACKCSLEQFPFHDGASQHMLDGVRGSGEGSGGSSVGNSYVRYLAEPSKWPRTRRPRWSSRQLRDPEALSDEASLRMLVTNGVFRRVPLPEALARV
jgi:hypothetical protein